MLHYKLNTKWGYAAAIMVILICLGGSILFSYFSKSARLEHFAFLAEIISSLATAATLIWLVVERNQLRNEKREDEKRKQAAGVSTWLSNKAGNGQFQPSYRIIVLNNNSDAPIYNVVIAIVDARDKNAKGEQTPQEFRRVIDASPPGQAFCIAPQGYNGAGFHPSVEIAFSDANGNHWARRGNGILENLPEDPFVHYAIPQPPTYTPLQTLRN